jgi:hypothetical protein
MNRFLRITAVVVISMSGAIVATPATGAGAIYTTITGPKGPGQGIYPFVNFDSGPTLTVGGKAHGLAPGVDTINVYCFANNDTKTSNSSDTPLNAAPFAIASDGSFSGVIGAPSQACILRALPGSYSQLATNGDNGGYVGAFQGPSYYTGGFSLTRNSDHRLHTAFAYAYGRVGAVQVGSPANQGLAVVAAWDDASKFIFPAFPSALNFALPGSNVVASGSPTRSAIVIDGLNAYTPGALADLTAAPTTLPQISLTKSRKSDGSWRLTESDPLSACAGNAYPQSSGGCTPVATGVRLVSSYVIPALGDRATKTDRFVVTDNAAHTIKLEYVVTQQDLGAGAAGVMLPGESKLHVAPTNKTVNNLPMGPRAIFTTSDIHARDNTFTRSDGALVYGGKPQLYFGPAGLFALRYTRHIARGGTATLSFGATTAFTVSRVKTLAAAVQKSLTPHLSLTAPAPTTSDNTPTIKGKVTNPVNGLPAKVTITIGGTSRTINVSPAGTFAVTWPALANGSRTATAKATDPAGRVLTASRTFTVT